MCCGGAAGNVVGFKHVQLELFRSAAQDLLARLAPDLLAQLLAIFRAHTRLPAFSLHSHPAVSPAAGPAGSAAAEARGQVPSAVTMAADLAAAAGASSADDPTVGTSAVLSPSGFSQMDLIPLSPIAQPRPSMVSFSELGSPVSFSSAHFPIGCSSRPSQLPTILSLLPTVEIPTGDVIPPVAVVGQETPRSIASVRAQAGQMQQQIGQDARHAHLVVLQALQTVQQTSHVLVMQGSVKLEGRSVNSQLAPGVLTCAASVNESIICLVG